MKITFLAMILACALSAGAQDAAPSQTQPGASGGGQQAAPEIKDPNEYNAYVAAIQQKDPTAKKITRLTYQRVLADRLEVMDAAAIDLARGSKIPIYIFSLREKGNIRKRKP